MAHLPHTHYHLHFDIVLALLPNDLSIDGYQLKDGLIELEEMNKFVLVRYDIPSSLTENMTSVRVQFKAHDDRKVPKVFAVRMIKN